MSLFQLNHQFCLLVYLIYGLKVNDALIQIKIKIMILFNIFIPDKLARIFSIQYIGSQK
jgi:hypothetical protein